MKSLSHEAHEWCKSERIEKRKQLYSVILDARYVGQNFELQITYKEEKKWKIPMPLDADEVVDRFNTAHAQLYGFANPNEKIEVVNIRLNVSGNFNKPCKPTENKTLIKSAIPIGERLVWFDDEKPLKTKIYDRTDFKAGFEIKGPAIIEQFDSTTVVYPKDRVLVDEALNLLISVS
jgi:N-methylhydantoinase A